MQISAILLEGKKKISHTEVDARKDVLGSKPVTFWHEEAAQLLPSHLPEFLIRKIFDADDRINI